MHSSPKTILLLLLCGLGVFVKAQTVWNKTFIEDRSVMVFSSIYAEDTVFKIIGLGGDTLPPYNGKAMIANIDAQGAMTMYKTSIDTSELESGVFLNTLIKTRQGGFAFTGYVTDSVPTLLFAKFDSKLDSLKIFKYTTPNTFVYLGNALLQGEDNYFYVAGIKTDNVPANGNVVLVKIDTLGNRVWEKFYNQLYLDDARSIIQLHNGNLLLGCVKNDVNQTHEHAHTWLLEVDTGGIVQRQWFDPNDSTYAAYGLKQTSDGGFIYGAQKKFSESGGLVTWTNTIVKMDSSFNKQWTYSGGGRSIYTAISDIEELSDGSFIACGQYTKDNIDILWGGIIKLDATGNILWERTYGGITALHSGNFLSDIDVLPDGSLVAVGQCKPYNNPNLSPQLGWFLKLDSNGCEIENCLTTATPKSPKGDFNSQIQVYPNPANSAFYLNIENPLLQGGSLDLYNIDGKKLSTSANHFSRQTKVDISQFPNGIYLWRYTAPDQEVQSGKVVKE